MDATITEVMLAHDSEECGYRLVALSDDRYAFVWGNIRARKGDCLPQGSIDDPTADEGVILCDSFDTAVKEWNDCAEALSDSGATRCAENLLALSAELATDQDAAEIVETIKESR